MLGVLNQVRSHPRETNTRIDRSGDEIRSFISDRLEVQSVGLSKVLRERLLLAEGLARRPQQNLQDDRQPCTRPTPRGRQI